MGDGAKEESAQQKEPKFLGKAGWLKKAPGRLLASYRDRYVHVEKTEVVLYENEDLENCTERLDLENYDRCHDLKSPFKKKHRLILIRSPKSGNKVPDIKFQAQNAEDKEAWIKAFRDGINRAKNKVFDEVKVDEASNLEHVTRTRPKGNRNRRPPTRIHMKEVADVSSDGILRLDLDLEDAVMPNGTHLAAVDGTHTSKDTTASTPQYNSGGPAETSHGQSADDEARPELEEAPQKKVIKPPMPPNKEAKASSVSQDERPEKKVLKPPMPPLKEAKPCASPVEEATEETQSEQVPEMSPEARKKSDPPPTPPNKPSSNNSMSSVPEASQPKLNPHPPTPPSKEKKPSHQTAVESDQQLQSSDQENKEKEEEASIKETVVETQEEDEPITEPELLHITDDEPESPGTNGEVSDEELQENFSGINAESNNEPGITAEPLRKSPSPLLTSKMDPDTPENCAAETHIAHPPDLSASDTSTSSLPAEDSMPESEIPPIMVSLSDSLTESLSLSPLLCHLSGEKKQKSEEKSVDSGQHSDDESECSGCEDTLAASTSALRGSHVGLDVLDNSEDDIQTSVPLIQKPVSNKPQIKPKAFAYRCLKPAAPLSQSVKAKSASSGDLLSSEAVCAQVKQPNRAGNESLGSPCDEVTKLESEVALEMENTSDLLSRVSDTQRGADGEGIPEDLLAKAMEKLKKADHVLREVNKLKLKHNSRDRKSW